MRWSFPWFSFCILTLWALMVSSSIAATEQELAGCWEVSNDKLNCYLINNIENPSRSSICYRKESTPFQSPPFMLAHSRFDSLEENEGTFIFTQKDKPIITMRFLSSNQIEDATPNGYNPAPRVIVRSSPETEARTRALLPTFAKLNGTWQQEESKGEFLRFDSSRQEVLLLDATLQQRFGNKPLPIASYVVSDSMWGTTLHLEHPETKERLWLHKAINSSVLGIGQGAPVKPEAYIAKGTLRP